MLNLIGCLIGAYCKDSFHCSGAIQKTLEFSLTISSKIYIENVSGNEKEVSFIGIREPFYKLWDEFYLALTSVYLA